MAGKEEEIKVRVSTEMKAKVVAVATDRGESESLIVREALVEYLAKHKAPEPPTPVVPPKKITKYPRGKRPRYTAEEVEGS